MKNSVTIKRWAFMPLVLTVSVFLCAIPLSANQATGGTAPSTFIKATAGPPTTSSTTIAAASTESFDAFYRYPTEVLNFTQMNGTPPTAYYRDEFIGGQTFTSGANDGDTMYAQLFDSNGTVVATWSNVVFYSSYSYNGQTLQNCFLIPGVAPLCGSTAITILWYYQSQCMDGSFSMQFYLNGAAIASSPFPFKVLPQIEESRVPNYTQVTTSDGANYLQNAPEYAYDFECRYIDPTTGQVLNLKEKHTCSSPLASNEIPYYIRAKGCFLTDAANVLGYHNVSVDPVTLNSALIQMNNTAGSPPGYTNYSVTYAGVHRYSANNGGNVSYVTSGSSNLFHNICTYGPQLMGVECSKNSPQHWVTVYGMNSDKSTWLIHDPGHSVAGTGPGGTYGGASGTLQDLYGGQFCTARVFSGPQHTFVTETGLIIAFHSPVQLVITDPLGRQLGLDAATGTEYSGIPDAYYQPVGLIDDETGAEESDPAKTLSIPRAAAGQYTLAVTGTDTSAYSADFISLDQNGTPTISSLKNVPIGLGETQTYTFNYSSTPGSSLQLSGGYEGGGQNPATVNTFLSYAEPTNSRVSLPAGTQSYTVVITYSSAVVPGTFSATLNGTDVSSLFHEQPGTTEGVTIPLQAGRNVLELEVQGNLPNRVATDRDRFVFNVQ